MILKPELVTLNTNPSNEELDKEKTIVKGSKVKADSSSDNNDEVQFEDAAKGSQEVIKVR